MRIAMIGATGRIGRHVAQEATARGHVVSALTRGEVDIFDAAALARAVLGHDVLVSAYGAPKDALLHLLAEVAACAALAARQSGVPRVLTVGGAGVLETAPGVRLGDAPDFPVALRPKVDAHAAAIAVLRAQEVDWTCMVPAAQIAAGPRTGRQRTAVAELVRRPDGLSTVSYADFACAVIDEIERSRHQRQVLGVGD